MLKITNPGVYIALVLLNVLMVLFCFVLCVELKEQLRRNKELKHRLYGPTNANVYLYESLDEVPTEKEAVQQDDGSYMCTRCRGDWYSCECPRSGDKNGAG